MSVFPRQGSKKGGGVLRAVGGIRREGLLLIWGSVGGQCVLQGKLIEHNPTRPPITYAIFWTRSRFNKIVYATYNY